MIDPFRLCVALAPLGFYLLALGLVNLSRRPRLTTGPRDMAALAAAVTGLIVIGPMELFLPEAAAIRFGAYVWLLMLAFYALSVSLSVLLSRPRLVIYNMTLDEIRPILAELMPTLDAHCRWAGDSVALPAQGVQFHLDSFPPMRNVSLVSSGDRQNFDGWRRLEQALRPALKTTRVQFNPRAVSMLGLGLMLLSLCLFHSLGDPQALAQGMRDMLRL